MALTPGYGETPVPEDDLEALVPRARQALEEPIIKAAIYDLEQAIQEDDIWTWAGAAVAPRGAQLERYDWQIDKEKYISLLRQYDGHRDPRDLAAFIPVQPFGD